MEMFLSTPKENFCNIRRRSTAEQQLDIDDS